LNGKGDPVLNGLNMLSPGNGTHRSAERGMRQNLIKNLKENSKKVRDRSANSKERIQNKTQGNEIIQGY